MSASIATASAQLREALSNELLRLARQEENVAADEAEQVHYWEPTPVTVAVHRRCAAALRAAADELLAPSHAEA